MQPSGLSIGDVYSEGGIDYEVVELETQDTYRVRIVGKSSIVVKFSELQSIDLEKVIVSDQLYPQYNGKWIFQNGNYLSQFYNEEA